MKIEEHSCYYGPNNDKSTRQAFESSNAVEWGAQIAVAVDILVAMAAQAFAGNHYTFRFVLSVKLIADITATALAGILIYIMGSFGEGPLVWVDLSATDITYLR
jgi:hypothetical protein